MEVSLKKKKKTSKKQCAVPFWTLSEQWSWHAALPLLPWSSKHARPADSAMWKGKCEMPQVQTVHTNIHIGCKTVTVNVGMRTVSAEDWEEWTRSRSTILAYFFRTPGNRKKWTGKFPTVNWSNKCLCAQMKSYIRWVCVIEERFLFNNSFWRYMSGI